MSLRRVRSVRDALGTLSVTRGPGEVFQTNFFPSEQLLQDWIEDEALFSDSVPGANVLVRRDRDFFHVFLTFVNADSANELISELLPFEILVADVVGRDDRRQPLLGLFGDAGFSMHRVLKRLRRGVASTYANEEDSVRDANVADLPWILKMLETHFDRFSEQLPTARQLQRACATNCIRTLDVNGEPVAFLFSEVVGLRTILRYWFVAPEHRENRFGARLMNDYLRSRCSGRVSELWIVNDNHNALKRYLHYGYNHNHLINYVMTRGLSQYER